MTGSCVKFGPPRRFSCVEVGEVAALQEWIAGEVDAWHHVLGAECNLFGLGEEVVNRAVEHETTDPPHWDEFLRDDLRGVEDVEVELVGELVVEELHAELPFGEVSPPLIASQRSRR